MSRRRLGLAVFPEPRWSGAILIVGVVVLVAAAVGGIVHALGAPTVVLADVLFWMSLAILAPGGVLAVAGSRYRGMVSRARASVAQDDTRTLVGAFSRGGVATADGSASAKEVAGLRRGWISIDGDTIVCVEDGGSPTVSLQISPVDIVAVTVVDAFRGLWFCPLLRVEFAQNDHADFVLVSGSLGDIFGPSKARVEAAVGSIRAVCERRQ